jgi:hypothetical protein
VTTDDNAELETLAEAEVAADPPAGTRRSRTRSALARISRHSRIVKVVALVATAAVVGAAYVVGGPPVSGGYTLDSHSLDQGRIAAQGVSPDSGGANPLNGSTGSIKSVPNDQTGPLAGAPGLTTEQAGGGQGQSLATSESNQIVKTGQLTLEVANLDNGTGQATTAIKGLGGTIDSSNQSGTGDSEAVSITFRVPVAKWDEALSDLHKIASKVIFEQTNTTDITLQYVDLSARIDNLQKTEAAFQALLARATVFADIIAVENQLSDTQGQIESLSAQLNHLKNQADMSTLSVSFQLPGQTVTAVAASDWTLGNQIDQAAAALVRIGQGLATMVVWVLVVVLPIAIAGLFLLGFLALIRRVSRRGRHDAIAGA